MEGHTFGGTLGKPQKKNSSTNGQPLRPYPPPPLELNGHRNFFLRLPLSIATHITELLKRQYYAAKYLKSIA